MIKGEGMMNYGGKMMSVGEKGGKISHFTDEKMKAHKINNLE